MLLLAPLRDLALDRLRDVAAHELSDVIVDRLDQLAARVRDDRFEMCGELRLEIRYR